MGVQAARVQQLIQGDDVVLRHTLVTPAAVGNNETLALVTIGMGDVVNAKYQTTQPTDESLPAIPPVSALGVAVSGQPSTFDFTIPAVDSAKLLVGKGQTVRIEITRSGGDLESHYLYDEMDVLARGFPVPSEAALKLP